MKRGLCLSCALSKEGKTIGAEEMKQQIEKVSCVNQDLIAYRLIDILFEKGSINLATYKKIKEERQTLYGN